MNFPELVNARESCRKYDPRAVEREDIIRIIEACRLAPSACNSQPWRFIVVDDPAKKMEVARATVGPMLQFNRFCLQAPVMVAIVAEKPTWIAKIGSSIKDKEFYLMDIGIAAEHFCLQAAELGLGTCMIGWFDEPAVRKILQIPDKKRIPLLISLGYPANTKNRMKIRKDQQEILNFNQY